MKWPWQWFKRKHIHTLKRAYYFREKHPRHGDIWEVCTKCDYERRVTTMGQLRDSINNGSYKKVLE